MPFLILLVLSLLAPMPGYGEGPDWKTVAYPPSGSIVKNPRCGYLFYPRFRPEYETADKVPAWVLDAASVAYFRIPWDITVNEKGEYDFDRLDAQFFAGYRQKGLRLSLRIMAGNRYAPTPSIFPREKIGKDIPFIKMNLVPPSGDRPSATQEMPIFWDEAYIREHGRLMEALGAWVDRHPEVDHVDFGGMGEWGEMHFVGWTESQKKAHGLTEEKYLNAVWRMMEQMERHLPRTPKAVCISPFGGVTEESSPLFKLITDRAVRNGWWLRTDAQDEKGAKPDVAPFFDRSAGRVPWIIEPAGGINRGYYGQAYPVGTYLDAAMKYRPYVINLMMMYDLGGMKADEQKTIYETGKKLGYRLQVAGGVLPEGVSYSREEGGSLSLSITLAQNGTVPYRGEAIYRLRFTQEGKTVHVQGVVPAEPLSTLLPGQKRTERLWVDLPAGISAVPTRVGVSLHDLETGPLRLDNAAVEDGFFLPLGTIDLRRPDAAAGVDLLPRIDSARKAETVEVSKAKEGWLIKGRDEKNWMFASLAGMPLEPECAYEMRVSVRAWKSEVADSRLYFKIGVRKTGAGGERNYVTDRYDFEREGTWQELRARYLSKANEEVSQFGVEKGRTAASTVHAEIRSWTLLSRPLAPLE